MTVQTGGERVVALPRVGPGHGVPELATVGGKARTLALLAQRGLPVPRGFCVPAAVHAAAGERPEALPAATRAAVGDALDAVFPPDARRPLLAVRSSAIDEDGLEHSFAGAFTSVLEVACAADAVERAVLECWRSVTGPRGVAYRRQVGAREGAMAVLVQELVPPVLSAVAFTKDPVTGREDHLVVTCAPGLGDALMSGGGDGITYTLDRISRRVLGVDGADRVAQARWAPAVRRLATLALLVERLLTCPADVEAVLGHDGWVLVQARPITT